MLYPEGVLIDGLTGAVTPETGRYSKRLSGLAGIFQDSSAFSRAISEQGSNPDEMHATGREAIAIADIVKANAEELLALASAADTASAVRSLWHSGPELFTPSCHVSFAGFPVKVADTVGCGDAFMAALLTGLPLERIATLREE
jgi:sugar/nucleoside kinase (ribokinase family)